MVIYCHYSPTGKPADCGGPERVVTDCLQAPLRRTASVESLDRWSRRPWSSRHRGGHAPAQENERAIRAIAIDAAATTTRRTRRALTTAVTSTMNASLRPESSEAGLNSDETDKATESPMIVARRMSMAAICLLLRYDMIRYDTVYLRALKSWREGQLNLAHGTETKNKEKLKTKTELIRNGRGDSPWRQSGRKKWIHEGRICETGTF